MKIINLNPKVMSKEIRNKIRSFFEYLLFALLLILMVVSNKKLKERNYRNKNYISVRVKKKNSVVTDKFFVDPNGMQWKESIFKNEKDLTPHRRYFLYDTNKDGKVDVIVLMYKTLNGWGAVVQMREEKKYRLRFEWADNEIKEILKVKITKYINSKNK